MILPLAGWQLAAAMALVWAGTYGCVAVTLEYRMERRRALWICAAVLGALLALSIAMSRVLSPGWFDVWRPAALFVPVPLFWKLSSDGFQKLQFIYFTFLNACGFVVMTSGLAASRFASQGTALLCIASVLFGAMFWLSAFKLREPFREVVSVLDRAWSVTALLPAAYTVLNVLIVGISASLSGVPLALAHAAAFLLFAHMCVSYCGVRENLRQSAWLVRSKENEALLTAQLHRQREEMEIFDRARQDAARFRHDVRHHANVIQRLLDDGDVTGAKEYISEIVRASESGVIKRWCANHTVNAILSIYAERAEKRGIKVEVTAAVPAVLGMDEMELASIYANAIENASEGCAAISAGTERWIKVNTSYENERLLLRVRNSCVPGAVKFDEMGMPITSKEKGGTGTRSIRYVVEKHGGTWFFDEEDGVFTTSVVINGV